MTSSDSAAASTHEEVDPALLDARSGDPSIDSVPAAFAEAIANVPCEVDLDAVFADFERDGYARLGRVAPDAVLVALRTRTVDIMEGRVVRDGLFFQRDSEDGRYGGLPYGRGTWQGATLRYRKIEKLERDPLFRAWLGNPLFRKIATSMLGTPVNLLRAMVMTKAAQGGTPLPWHQDGGRFWGVSKTPKLQLWTALDDAPLDAGPVEVLTGSHHRGLATEQGGVVPAPIVDAFRAEERALALPAKAGEVILIHNMMWHRSGVNVTDAPRRAFSVCFIDDETKCTRTRKAPRTFERIF